MGLITAYHPVGYVQGHKLWHQPSSRLIQNAYRVLTEVIHAGDPPDYSNFSFPS